MARGMVETRLAGYAAGLVCTAMFFGITRLSPYVASFDFWPAAAATVASGLLGYAAYKALLALLLLSFRRSRFLRGKLLGRHFIEGIWIGWYERDHQPLLTIETIDQRGDSIRITGRAIDAAGALHTVWNSTSASFNHDNRQLCYSYNCKILARPVQHEGLGAFQVEDDQNDVPCKLIGYAVDVTDGSSDSNREFRVGALGMSDADIFAAARIRFPDVFGPTWPSVSFQVGARLSS